MDSQLMQIYLLHEFLSGSAPDIATFDARLLAQKIGYLALRAYGLPMGPYRFSWYKRGPYSPAYASALRAIRDRGADLAPVAQRYVFSPYATERLIRLRTLLHIHRPVFASSAEWAEALASSHFIWERDGLLSSGEVVAAVTERKPFLSQGLLGAAVRALVNDGVMRLNDFHAAQ